MQEGKVPDGAWTCGGFCACGAERALEQALPENTGPERRAQCARACGEQPQGLCPRGRCEGGDRVVKVVLEGNTQIYDWTNKDNSMEIDTYRKLGVAILTQHNWGIYQNTGITQTYQE